MSKFSDHIEMGVGCCCVCIVDDVIVLWTVNFKTESRVDPTTLPDVSECIGLLKRDICLFAHYFLTFLANGKRKLQTYVIYQERRGKFH